MLGLSTKISMFGVIVVVGAASTACQPPVVNLAKTPHEYVSSDYQQVLKKWTRTGHLISFDQLDDLLTATATYQSYDFRWAYVVRYAYDYRLTIEQRQKLFEESFAQADLTHEFFVALYSPKWRWSDLTDERSAWVVRLVDDQGNQTFPSQIIPINRPGALEQIYFPYATDWRRLYRIRFPVKKPNGAPVIPSDVRWFGLRFSGPQGSNEVRWYVKR